MMERDDAYTLTEKKLDAAAAFTAARKYHAELREIYRYFAPFRLPTSERSSESGAGIEGGRLTTDLFDGTGPSAMANFVANMKADWMPSFEEFFTLDNGPLFPKDDADRHKQRRAELQSIASVLHGLLRPVTQTCDPLFQDYFNGTGAMFVGAGDRRQPIRGVTVPPIEIALAAGPWDDIERWFWKRKFEARHIPQMWPKADIPKPLADKIKLNKGQSCPVEVTQYTYWDARNEVYRFCVWCDAAPNDEIWADTMKATPWITPRAFTVPGEAMGRGWAHIGLPFAKTLNKARELALQAAAFALLGIWTYRHDGVFNPDNAVMLPGSMWKVSTNGGPLGASVQRLDVPHDFNISTIVIAEERNNLREVLLDAEMPDISDSVRTPTEIAGRMRRYERNRGGATTRLAHELVRPLVQRGLDVMVQQRLLPIDITIDQLLTEVVITAPAAAAMKSARVERTVSFLQILVGLLGPQAPQLYTALEDVVPQLARDSGLDEQQIRSRTEMDTIKDMIAEAVARAQEEAEAQRDQPAAAVAQPTPDAQFLQGAGF